MPTEISHEQVADAPREHKSFAVARVDVSDDQPGLVEAIVGVFGNVDHGGDRIRPGFFAKSIARKLPKIAWGHDFLTPVGKTLEARELHPGDPMLPADLAALGGLYVKGQFNLETQRGREAHSDIKFGAIDEFSFGYRATEFEVDKKTGVRDLIEGSIFEWSPVLAGMNDRTRLLSVKSAEESAGPADRADAHESSPREPSETKGSWSAYSREVATAVGEFAERATRRVHNRLSQKAGRVLSQSNYDSIATVADAMESNAGQLRAVLAAASVRRNEPADDTAKAKADDAVSVETTAAAPTPAAGAATPAVPTVAEPASPDEPPAPSAPGPESDASASASTSAAVLAELIHFEIMRAASLGVPVGS